MTDIDRAAEAPRILGVDAACERFIADGGQYLKAAAAFHAGYRARAAEPPQPASVGSSIIQLDEAWMQGARWLIGLLPGSINQVVPVNCASGKRIYWLAIDDDSVCCLFYDSVIARDEATTTAKWLRANPSAGEVWTCLQCHGHGSIPNGTDEMACGTCRGTGSVRAAEPPQPASVGGVTPIERPPAVTLTVEQWQVFLAQSAAGQNGNIVHHAKFCPCAACAALRADPSQYAAREPAEPPHPSNEELVATVRAGMRWPAEQATVDAFNELERRLAVKP